MHVAYQMLAWRTHCACMYMRVIMLVICSLRAATKFTENGFNGVEKRGNGNIYCQTFRAHPYVHS